MVDRETPCGKVAIRNVATYGEGSKENAEYDAIRAATRGDLHLLFMGTIVTDNGGEH